MARVTVPPMAEWIITCELVDKDGQVLGRSIPLRWSASWARDAHTNTVGTTFQGFLTQSLNMMFASTRRRR